MKKIAIIGGGITGCLIALYLSKKKYKVEIFEKKKNLGGIINDLKYNGDYYFNGPNFFDVKSWWIKALKEDKAFKKIFSKFKLNYGSYNDLFGREIYSNDFAQIVTNEKFKKIKKKKDFSYVSRINCYQDEISSKIFKWSKRFCKDILKLHEDCSLIMNTSRVFFKKDIIKIKELKLKNDLSNEILGIPNKSYTDNQYYIPKKGFEEFFKILERYLKKNKIKINFESNIQIKSENNMIYLSNKYEKLNFDFTLWCANPVQLLKNLKIGDLDNPIVKVHVLALDLSINNKFNGNKYIQVFSQKFNLFRIFLYKINNQVKMSLEILHDRTNDIKKEINFAIKILKKNGYIINKKNLRDQRKEVRHLLFTNSDLKKMKFFEKKQKEFKIISGGWYKIGREKKLAYIINTLKELSL